MSKILKRAVAPVAAVAIVSASAIACTPYNPSNGLKSRAERVCSGYYQGHTNGYAYGDPRFRYWETWVNTDRRPEC